MSSINETRKRPVSVDVDSGEVYYSASALGSCTFDLVAFRKSLAAESTPKWLELAFQQGHDNEDLILDMLSKESGVELLNHRQKQVAEEIMPGVFVVGHIDDETETAVVDAKAVSATTYAKWITGGWAAFPHYAYQQKIYAQLLGKEYVVMAWGLKNKKGVVEKIMPETYHVSEIAVTWDDVVNKITDVEAWAQKDEFPLTDCEDSACPFAYMRKELNTYKYEDAELDNWISDLALVNESIKTDEETKKTLNKKIFGRIDGWAQKGKRLASSAWEVKDVVTMRSNIDMDKLRADIDVEKYKKTPSETRYVKIFPVDSD